MEFWCSGRRWRCTDVGTRVVVGICLEPHEVVTVTRESPTSSTTMTRTISDDPRGSRDRPTRSPRRSSTSTPSRAALSCPTWTTRNVGRPGPSRPFRMKDCPAYAWAACPCGGSRRCGEKRPPAPAPPNWTGFARFRWSRARSSGPPIGSSLAGTSDPRRPELSLASQTPASVPKTSFRLTRSRTRVRCASEAPVKYVSREAHGHATRLSRRAGEESCPAG
jgi:hypothetical protein